MAGEWIVYKGSGQFWGFDEPIHMTEFKRYDESRQRV